MTLGERDHGSGNVRLTGGGLPDVPGGSTGSAEDRYQLLLEHSPVAICVHQQARVVYVNRAGVREMLATSVDDIVGRPITDLVDPGSVPSMLERISALRRQGDVSEPSEAELIKFDGTRLNVEAVSVLTTWNGAPAYQVIFRDLTENKVAQAALRSQAALVDHVSDAIIATTASGVITSWNRAAEAIYGRPAAKAVGSHVSEAVGARLDPADVIAQGGTAGATHRAADGRTRAVRISVAAMDDGYVLLCSDQTALRRAEQHFQTVVRSLDEGIAVLNARGELISVNPAVRRVLQLEEADEAVHFGVVADRWKLDPDGPLPASARPFLDTLRTGVPFRGEVYNDLPSGERRWLAVSSRRLNPSDGDGSAVLITLHDVTAVRTATDRLAHQARHDPLTGLPNRAHLIATTERLLADAELAAVLFLDLDDFKRVNDTLGHDVGDAVICIAAQRIRDSVRRQDVVCRLAGDEFVVLMTGAATADDVTKLCERVVASLGAPITVAESSVRVAGSVGVVRTAPGEHRDAATLLRQADGAMYEVKARDRRAVEFGGPLVD